ncbi:acylphosphatase [Endozoicomonas gorgoniicola]|uniref:acylphosphatase n=1 Tax=Endozoicomonas gorgoniicola TaxID=1234144 RepID=A0ABT3MVX6_9GAMM|nr:acylphosphatase [Endozoicomonas gorgoniicola]MCW7553531.1 acylphosphatase [Endozoicomonas gorgoniicola]
MAKVCKRALVKGRVQGVWYRGSTQRKAQELGISGWAKNLADGRVEVLMCGEESALSELADWLHEGPPMAQVESVNVSDEPWQAFETFTTG